MLEYYQIMPVNPFELIPPLAENQAETPAEEQTEKAGELIDLENVTGGFEDFLSALKIGLAENRVDMDQAAELAAHWLKIIWEDEDQTDYYDDETNSQVYPEYYYKGDEKQRLLEATESFQPAIVESVVKNLSRDSTRDYTDIESDVPLFLRHVDELVNFDHSKLAYGLIEAGFGKQVIGLDIFDGLDRNELAKHLLEKGQGVLILKNAEEFPNIPKRQIVLDLIEKGEVDGLAVTIPKLNDIPKEEHEKFALAIIEKKGSNEVLRAMRALNLPDKNKIAEAILSAGRVADILNNLGSFPDLAADKVVDAVLNDSDDFSLQQVLSDDSPYAQLFKRRLNIVKDNAFAKRIIRAGKIKALKSSIKVFTDLEEDTALELLANGYGAVRLVADRGHFHNLTHRLGLVLIYQKNNERILKGVAPELVPDENTAPWIKRCFEIRDDKKIPQKIRLSEENATAVLVGAMESQEALPAALLARMTHRLSPLEYLALKKSAAHVLDKPKENASVLCRELATNPGLIKNDNLRRALALGSETFGERTMLEYMNRADMARHDALYFMTSLVALYKKSGLGPEAFSVNVLMQIAKDQAVYDTGTAHHEFASVCQALEKTDQDDIKAKIERYANVQGLQGLAQELDKGGPFASWKALKKYRDVVQLLRKTKVLEQLNSPNMPPRMRAFLEKLAFHPNIAMDKVMQFWQDPAHFLAIDDHHTNAAINGVKKPSNYISLPHLGLTAENLRDAYVEGDIDEIQTLPTMERIFENVVNDEATDPATPLGLHAALTNALGQERKGVKGQAARPKKVFDNVKKLCMEQGIVFQDLIRDPEVIKALKSETRAELEGIIFESGIGIKKLKGDTYRIRIGRKGDPDMTVAGNDTASCMPFGSGKNNVYMFNPNCVQLVVERQTADGTWRTAAQSVVTIDHKATKTTPELIEGYMRQHQALKDLFNPDDFATLPVVTCDNIEIAKNEEGARYRNIKTVYEKFFRDYLEENAEKLRVDKTKVAIGQGYTPNELGFRSETNHFVPQAPMGYSDNVHANCFVLDTGLEAYEPEKKAEIRPLDVRDAIAAAYIEGKAYADNESLMEYLHKVQNNIIGSQIANEFFDRPNLSFIVKDENNVPLGYMIAYEGNANDQPMVYISDLAADPENKMAGPALVRTFIRNYFGNYGTEQKPYIPIFTNAREKTSYQWILRLAQAEAKKHNVLVELVELGVYEQGKDNMHNVLLLIAKDVEELKSLKEKYSQESLHGEEQEKSPSISPESEETEENAEW
ncbi:MAG: hypothetical protein WCW31_03870 [Patescibacteria group bacterium]